MNDTNDMSENAFKLDVWREEIEARFVYAGMSKKSAGDEARSILTRVLSRIGGEGCYLPQRIPPASVRAAAVDACRGGEPVSDVAREYGITRQTLSRWLKDQ